MHASPRLAWCASGAVFAVVALMPVGACSSSDDSPDARSDADATSTSTPPPLPGEEPSTVGPSAATADERFSALERDYAARLGVWNDIAVAWPPDGAPIVIAVLSTRDQEGADHDDQLVADAAEVVVDAFAG